MFVCVGGGGTEEATGQGKGQCMVMGLVTVHSKVRHSDISIGLVLVNMSRVLYQTVRPGRSRWGSLIGVARDRLLEARSE